MARCGQCLTWLSRGNQKSSSRIPQQCGDRALADNRTADAEVAMQTRYLLLVPVLVSIAGCSEKIEAQENDPQPSEV